MLWDWLVELFTWIRGEMRLSTFWLWEQISYLFSFDHFQSQYESWLPKIVSFLPEPAQGTAELAQRAIVAWSSLIGYVAWLDWFIDLRLYIQTLAFMLLCEFALISWRLWMFGRRTLW